MKKLNFLFLIVLLFLTNLSAEPLCYGVHLNDQVLFCVKQGIGSVSAQSRAGIIEEKIVQLANNYSFDPTLISANESEGGYSINGGDVSIVSLRPVDIETGADLKTQAELLAKSITAQIVNYRELRSPKTILIGTAYSIAAILILILCWSLLNKAKAFLLSTLSIQSEKYVDKLKIKSYQLISPHRINQLLVGLVSGSKFVASLILIYFFVPLIFSFFPWTAKWAPHIISFVLNPVQQVFKVIFEYLPNVFYIFVILAVTHYSMKFVKIIFNEIETGSIAFNGFYKEWAQPTFKLLRVVAYGIALVMIFPYLPGSSSPAFQGLSVFLGVLVSFSSGSAIANTISGIVMTYMRPFKIGDRVRIADTVGDVVEKTFLVTRIKTIKNVDITVPNAMVLGSHIINYSSSAQKEGLILNTTVTIGYDVPWKQVHELLKMAAAKTQLIDLDKSPFILQTSLDDFYVSYELNAFTKHANKMALIYSELHQNIQDSFNEAKVEIMSPHYGALRDGNETTVPSKYRNKDYRSPTFQITRELSNK